MLNQPSNGGQTAGASVSEDATDYAHAQPRNSGVNQCPTCGALNHPGATVCPECGEALTAKPKQLRCRHCQHKAPSNLVICPHCGRELHPAPSRLLTWGAPALILLLFLLALSSRWESGGPFHWMRERAAQGAGIINGMGAQMDPQVTLEMTPVAVAQLEPATATTGDDAGLSPTAETVNDTARAALVPAPETPEATATSRPTETPSPVPTETPTATSTVASTNTPRPTATKLPTSTGTADATAAATASEESTSEESAEKAATVQPTPETPGIGGAVILLPTATPTKSAATAGNLTPTDTPAPTPVTTYTVQAGDTFVAIAAKLGVTTADLLAANGMSENDARLLSLGQELLVPGRSGGTTSTATPVPTAVPTATATRTAATVAPTATATPEQPAYRLDTPVLRSPESNTPVSCSSNNQLIWDGVPFILETDQYIMHLGFVNGMAADGTESIVWVLHQPRPFNRTLWDMDNELCSLAPQDYGRQWRWYVEVVNAQGEPVSRPSSVWGFGWN